MSDFDWSDEEIFKIPEQPETALFLNPHGAVVIRQTRALDDDDVWVVIQPNNLKYIIAELTRLDQMIDGAGHE